MVISFLIKLIVLSAHVFASPCTTDGYLPEPRHETDQRVLDMSRNLTSQILDHLHTQKKSVNARRIIDWMSSDNVYVFTGTSSARIRFDYDSGQACIFINPDDDDNTIVGRLQSKLCHELAHITGWGHDRKWRDTWTYLLNLSSRDLGWENHLECGSCIKYTLCHTKMCPRCTWTEGDHTMCKPLHERGTQLNT